MSDRRNAVFHLARAQAEHAAANRAASALTRVLHLELAALHRERANEEEVEPLVAVAIPPRGRQGMSVRSGLDDVLASAVMPDIKERVMFNQRWTQSHLTDLRRRATQGESILTIAGAVHRSPEDIRVMVSRLRLRIAAR